MSSEFQILPLFYNNVIVNFGLITHETDFF